MIDKFMYGETSVNVAGSLYCEVTLGKKQKTILQHTFMAGEPADEVSVSLKLPTKASLAELRMMAAELVRAADMIEAEISNPTKERLNTQHLDSGETKVIER
jgi:hypothetical protein